MRERRGARTRRRTFPELLTRSLAVSGLVYAMTAAYLVPATMLAQQVPSSPEPPSMFPHAWSHPGWQPSYDARFPGCVDIETWAGLEAPTAVVAVRRSGDAVRMPFDTAYERARSRSHADDVWTVGVCR